MLKNYFKIAWRNLHKNKVYSSINILGLSIGMGISMLIGLWIWDELSYNKGFDHYREIVQVKENSTHGNATSTFNSVPIPLSVELSTKYASDFKRVSMTSWNFSHILSFGEKKLDKSGMYVQPDFADMTSLKMIKGSWKNLKDPTSIVLSESLAKAMFGNNDPINQVIKFDNKTNLKVAGVFADFGYNSDFRYVTFLAPWSYFVADQPWVKNSETNWDNNSFQIYAQLADAANLNKVRAKVKGALTGHERTDKPEVILQPMSNWHLYSEFKNGKNTGGAIQFVWMFGIIGFFVLLLACINFMNLSTARSEKRAKEVGIRKAIGSIRRQLVIQFLSESVLMSFLAFILAIIMVSLSLPWFNQLADKQMNILWGNGLFWTIAIGFTLFSGLVSGSYPALYLSSFSSVKVLKGTFKAGRFAAIPRKMLVVLQFTVSASLIIGTIIIFQQIQFARNRPVGYTREGLMTVIMNTPDLTGHYEAMRNDLINSGAAINMAESSGPVTELYAHQSGFEWKGKDPNMVPTFGVVFTTHDLGKTAGWQFKEGRDFSRTFTTDSTGMVLNEAAVKYMGLEKPVGETVKYLYSDRADKNYKIIGVIKDVVMESPFSPVTPTIFMINYDNVSHITIRINPALSTKEALNRLETVFKRYNPGAPFTYTFADEDYANKFTYESRIGSLATFFAIFAVFISCLGLFGLASFTAEQRTKEIGVRKVLGASIWNVWSLLSKDFLMLVGISFFVAVPISYYFMHHWLEHYDYRTTISIWVFFITGILALVITLVTVSFQAIKAALMNPVKSLRSE